MKSQQQQPKEAGISSQPTNSRVTMHPRITSTLAELEEKEWFTNIGKHDSERVVFVSGWDAAIESCQDEKWLDLCQEAANQYRARLAERNRERFREWNERVRELKNVTIPLVVRKTKKVVDDNRLPKVFVDTVQWDILHLCMEAEFADVFPPGFYASQAYWYVNGHFPCGWKGQFPDGKLLVY
jgi:hypothetical protein